MDTPNLTPLMPGDRASRVGFTVSNLAARGLTGRENEVLRWVAEGKRDGEFAVILGIGVRMVNTHVSHILVKLSAETRTAAARAAREPRSETQAA